MQKVKNGAKLSAFFIALLILFVGVIYVLLRNSGIVSIADSKNIVLDKLLHKSYVGSGPYVAGEVIPPTNKWFSSLAFKQPSDPVFALPLAFKTNLDGFSLSTPKVTTTETLITAPFTEDVKVTSSQKLTQQIEDYDDLSVELAQKSGNSTAFITRLTRGSPFAFVTLSAGNELDIALSSSELTGRSDNSFIAKDSIYGVFVPKVEAAQIVDGNLKIKSGSDELKFAIFTIPIGASDQFVSSLFDAAENPVLETSVDYDVSDNKLMTSFNLKTENDQQTVLGLLPFMQENGSADQPGRLTIEGKQTYQTGSSFSFESDLLAPEHSLDLSQINDQQKANLVELIKNESAELSFSKDDSYFAFKELYRAARLLQLSNQLQLATESEEIYTKLNSELSLWLDPLGYKKRGSKFFYYDNGLKGLVAEKSAFGSEEFNDHHFHYGYFISAAAIAAEYSDNFLSKHKDFVNLIVDDVANTDRNSENFPYVRTFDPYIGHSWASGFSPFADGQNQESTSEAVQLWSAVNHWAKINENNQLQNLSQALFTREASAAQHQWLTIDKSNELYKDFEPPIVSLVWGGKLEYGTFFSDKPEAKLGIQLLPMPPSAKQYLGKISKTAAENSLNGLGTNESSQFNDYIVMYKSLFGEDDFSSDTDPAKLFSKDYDEALSASYYYAWFVSD